MYSIGRLTIRGVTMVQSAASDHSWNTHALFVISSLYITLTQCFGSFSLVQANPGSIPGLSDNFV